MKFIYKVPTSDYSITQSGSAIKIAFSNNKHYKIFKNHVVNGTNPVLIFKNADNSVYIALRNYVLFESNGSNVIWTMYQIDSNNWGNAVNNQTIPLYFQL